MLVLAACVVAGFGITYLSQVELNLEERIAFGTVLGAMAIASVSFVLSMAVRDVTPFTVLTATLATTAVAVAILVPNRTQLGADLSDARVRWTRRLTSPGHPWPLVAIFLLCAAWTVPFFGNAYQYRPDGLYAGYINIWGDWAAHLSFTGSFAYGHNFPPEFPIDPGNHLGYPFMMDFLAANLVALGSSLTSSLVLTSGLLGLAFPAVMYLAASRFAGGRAAGAIATVVFLMSGGIGFVYLLGDLATRGLTVLSHLPREYTLDRELNFQWLNPVLAYLVPQRTTLFGFSLALIVLLLVWTATREELGWPAYLFAGVVAGLMPAFHVHAWGTVVALSAFWFVFTRRREWLAFFVPAVVLAAPVLVWMWPPANNSYCGESGCVFGYCFEPGWLSYTDIKRDEPVDPDTLRHVVRSDVAVVRGSVSDRVAAVGLGQHEVLHLLRAAGQHRGWCGAGCAVSARRGGVRGGGFDARGDGVQWRPRPGARAGHDCQLIPVRRHARRAAGGLGAFPHAARRDFRRGGRAQQSHPDSVGPARDDRLPRLALHVRPCRLWAEDD